MITGNDLYEVLSAVVPLYVAMILAYGSVRWWGILTPDQCVGISRFVSVFAVPLLSFHFISSNDPYAMNFRFIAADCLQKVAVIFVLFLWHVLAKIGGTDWYITLFALSTLPNTLVMGVPLLKAMYGDFSTSLIIQIVVLQGILWYTLLIVLYECRAAVTLLSARLPPEVAGAVASFEVESDVVSLSGKECLEADADVGGDGKVRVVIRRSSDYSRSRSKASADPRGAVSSTSFHDLGLGMEIYSLPSSRETTPRARAANFYPLSSRKVMSLRSEDREGGFRRVKGSRSSKSSGDVVLHKAAAHSHSSSASLPAFIPTDDEANNKLHMFAWSTGSASIHEEVSNDFTKHHTFRHTFQEEPSRKGLGLSTSGGSQVKEKLDRELHAIDETKKPRLTEAPLLASGEEANKGQGRTEIVDRSMPPTSAMARLIVIIVWRKLIRNPNTYASIIGLVWSLISFRWNVKLPKIIDGSITILSNTGLGMAMFTLGLFMAVQPKIITCGKRLALFSMFFRFLVGPIVTAGTSAIVGLRGDLLRVSILQASLPQAIVTFVFAKDYDCHADIISTAVIFGMVVALPITIIYFVILGIV